MGGGRVPRRGVDAAGDVTDDVLELLLRGLPLFRLVVEPGTGHEVMRNNNKLVCATLSTVSQLRRCHRMYLQQMMLVSWSFGASYL